MAIVAIVAIVTIVTIVTAFLAGLMSVAHRSTCARTSAIAGLSVNTGFYNRVLGVVMLTGRFIPILLVLALAGSLARQAPVPPTAGTLPTHRPLFVGMLVGVVTEHTQGRTLGFLGEPRVNVLELNLALDALGQ